ncbi:hypothetical protein PTKIN_Ptkin02bG0124400 [Pterospermum kingtungense]
MGLWESNKSVVLVKCQTLDGDSPVAESITSLRFDPSSMGHVESRVNQQGPPCKAKYSWVTDSKVVPLVVSTACPGLSPRFDSELKKPPTDALRLIIPDNACILCITATVGTELANAYSPDTIIAYFSRRKVHDPWAFYLHAALLCQAFAYCEKFPTAASYRSLGCVSVPVWLIILADQLLIIALVSYCLTN